MLQYMFVCYNTENIMKVNVKLNNHNFKNILAMEYHNTVTHYEKI